MVSEPQESAHLIGAYFKNMTFLVHSSLTGQTQIPMLTNSKESSQLNKLLPCQRNQMAPPHLLKHQHKGKPRAGCGCISLEEIRPFPKAGPRKSMTRGGRKKGKCMIATDTPEKNEKEERARLRKAPTINAETLCFGNQRKR
ncbi:DDE [Nesidiocoris tenuis]|uniref:DDE n=1 Tax=Nesidiocoris tenuis TaxID=355587 RepID=A0ABN7AI47_9HEMI|nr:DDE [Nesidiocoris tenuis]